MNGHLALQSADALARKIREASDELRAALPGAGATLETIVTATLAGAEGLLQPTLVSAVDVVLAAPAGPDGVPGIEEAVQTSKEWKEWAAEYLRTLDELKANVADAKAELAMPVLV